MLLFDFTLRSAKRLVESMDFGNSVDEIEINLTGKIQRKIKSRKKSRTRNISFFAQLFGFLFQYLECKIMKSKTVLNFTTLITTVWLSTKLKMSR